MEEKKKPVDVKQHAVEQYLQQKQNLIDMGFHEIPETISILRANIFGILAVIPFVIIACLVWAIVQEKAVFMRDPSEWLLSVFLFFITIFVHEVLHGCGWSVFSKKGWKSIYIGMMWKSLTPYCHCKEPLQAKQYMAGTIVPFLVLGVGFTGIAVLTGSELLMWLALLNIMSAGGDLLIFMMTWKYRNRKALVMDHPTDCGFITFE